MHTPPARRPFLELGLVSAALAAIAATLDGLGVAELTPWSSALLVASVPAFLLDLWVTQRQAR